VENVVFNQYHHGIQAGALVQAHQVHISIAYACAVTVCAAE